jgi:butyrate kinase
MSDVVKILAINPGSTSTKVAMFENEIKIFSLNISHDAAILKGFAELNDQLPYRKETILNELARNNVSLADVDAFVGRGGGLVSLEGGVYPVNNTLLQHAKMGYTAKHPAAFGAQLADDFAQTYGGKAFVVNPPDVDEFEEVARVCGIAEIHRESRVHALNQKEIGLRYAETAGKKYEEMNLLICHIGGGISVTAHKQGRMVDSNDIVQGDGPMAPTRAGAIPASPLIKLCFSGKYSKEELLDLMSKNGGLVDHLGTSDAREVVERIAHGDNYAKLIYDAMIYQIAKSVGSYAAVLEGKVDAILLTGGIANDKYLVGKLSGMIQWIAPIAVMAGEFEMEALAAGALRVLSGQEQPKEYTGQPVWTGFIKS